MVDGHQTTTGLRWDTGVSSPYYNYKDKNDVVHQRWFDNATSLELKYKLAKQLGLRGVGPYTYSDLDYSTATGRQEAAAMWDALKVFSER